MSASPLSTVYCKTPVSASESPGYFKQLISLKDLKLRKLKELYEQEVTEKCDLYEDITKIKEEINVLRRENKDKSTTIRQLNETILLLEAQQNDENEDEKTRIRRSLERRHSSELKLLEQKFDQCLKERFELESWKEKHEPKLKSIAKDLQLRSIEVQELAGIKQALAATVEEQNHEIFSLRNSCNELREMLAAHNPEQNISVDDSFHGHQPEITESLAVVVELQLQEAKEENEVLKNQIGKKAEVIQNLEKSVAEARVECQALKEKLSESEASLVEKSTTISEKETALISLEGELKDLQLAYSQLEEQKKEAENHWKEEMGKLQDNNNGLLEQVNALQQDTEEKDAALLTMSSNYTNEYNLNQALNAKLVEMDSSLDEKAKEIADKEEMISMLEENLTCLKSAHTQLEQEKGEVEMKLKEVIASLEINLAELLGQKEILQKGIQEKQAELDTMGSKYESERSQNLLLSEKLKEAESSLDEKLKEMAENGEAITRLEETLSNTKFAFSLLEGEKNEAQAQLQEEIEKLQNSHEEILRNNEALYLEIEQKQAELIDAGLRLEAEHRHNEYLSGKINELELSHSDKLQVIAKNEEELSILNEEVNNLKVMHSQLEKMKLEAEALMAEETAKFEHKISELVEQNQLMSQDIQGKQTALLDMSSKYEAANCESEQLKRKLIDLESSLSDLGKKITAKDKAYTKLEKKLNALKSSHSQLQEKKKEDENKDKEKIAKLKAEIEKLTGDSKSLSAELSRVSSNYEKKISQNQQLSKKMKGLDLELKEKLEIITTREEMISQLKEKLASSELAYFQLDADKNNSEQLFKQEETELEANLSKLVQENDTLKQEVDSKQAELSLLASKYESEEHQNKTLNEKLVEAETSLQEKLTKISENEDLISRLEEEQTNLKSACSQLKEEKKEVETKLKNEIERLETDLKKITETSSALQVEIQEKENELSTSKSMYECERDRNQCLSEKLTESETSLSEKLKTISDNEEILSSLNKEISNLRSAYSKLEDQKSELETLNTTLTTNLSTVTEQKNSLQQEIQEKEDELSAALSNLEKESSLSEELKNKVIELESSFAELSQSMSEKEETFTRVTNELTSLKSSLLQLEEEKAQLSDSLEEKTELEKALKQELEAKSSEIQSISSSYEEERKQNQVLNTKLIELEFSLGETLKDLNNNKEAALKFQHDMNCLKTALSELEQSKKSESEQSNEEVAQLHLELKSALEQADTLRRDIEEKRAELLTMSLNQESERDKNQRLNEKLSELERSLKEKVEELKTSKQAAEESESELKSLKSKFVEFAENNNQVVTNMKGEFHKMESYIKELTKENNELKAEIDKKSAELQDISRINEGEANENAKTLDEIKALLEKNVELKDENVDLKEAYSKLLDDFERQRTEMMETNEVLSKQVEEYRDASTKYELKWKDRMKQVKEDYEGQLTKIKQYMTKHYHEKLDKQEKEAEEKLKVYKEKIAKDQDCIKDLSSQIWNLSEKYLQAQQEIKNVTCNNRRATIGRLDLAKSPDGQLLRSMSVDHLRGGWEKEREKLIVKNDNTDFIDEVTYTRRRKLVPSGIGKKLSLQSGKVFPSEEDEDGELFDAACLADLKEGRVRLSPDRDMRRTSSRLSILQARNSLCPPHLKSSYPAETQFLHPAQIREDDIKLGIGDTCSDTGSMTSNPDRKKKDAGQTLYKKPGPPTPSKHGGRLSHGGGPLPKSPLENKENINTRVKHPSTPSKIMDFFRNKMRREERPQPVAFSISPGPNTATNRTRRSGFFTKKSERV